MGKKRVAAKGSKESSQSGQKQEDVLKRGFKVKTGHTLKIARIYINSSYNNTKLSLADEQGNVVLWSSAGRMGFKGTKKGTPFAASKVADFISEAAKQAGAEDFKIFVCGIGSGRDAALRALAAKNLNIILLKDVTPVPHNGPRPRKVRRA